MPTWDLKYETVISFVRHQFKKNPVHHEQLTVVERAQRRRVAFEKSAMPVSRERAQIDKFQNESIKGEWLIVKELKSHSHILLYLHGGGYCMGSPTTHRKLVFNLAKISNSKALSLNYRLAPEFPFPHALEDAYNAYLYLIKEKIAKPDEIIIAGDSAGGGLSIATALRIRDEKQPNPLAVIALSPWLDLTLSMDSWDRFEHIDYLGNKKFAKEWVTAYSGEQDVCHPYISPYYLDDFSNLPPILIQAGSAEALVDESIKFYEKAKGKGGNVTLQIAPDMVHVFHAFAGLHPAVRQYFTSASEWLTEVKKKTNTSQIQYSSL